MGHTQGDGVAEPQVRPGILHRQKAHLPGQVHAPGILGHYHYPVKARRRNGLQRPAQQGLPLHPGVQLIAAEAAGVSRRHNDAADFHGRFPLILSFLPGPRRQHHQDGHQRQAAQQHPQDHHQLADLRQAAEIAHRADAAHGGADVAEAGQQDGKGLGKVVLPQATTAAPTRSSSRYATR